MITVLHIVNIPGFPDDKSWQSVHAWLALNFSQRVKMFLKCGTAQMSDAQGQSSPFPQ